MPHALPDCGIDGSPREPSYGDPEVAVRREYNVSDGTWTETKTRVLLDSEPFQEGSLRRVYFMMDLDLPNQSCVAKLSKHKDEERERYYNDVVVQHIAAGFAQRFNDRRPPKQVSFVLPWVVEFRDRRLPNGRRLVMHAEPLMTGVYIKHTNNYGYVNPLERNTPQAFSHFTFEDSERQLLVCDIQGIGDEYTDPQIHSVTESFGPADLGLEGIRQFFKTHRCNIICKFLKLPPMTSSELATRFDDDRDTANMRILPRPRQSNVTPLRHRLTWHGGDGALRQANDTA